MASDGNIFEILPDPHLKDLTTPAVTTFLETRRRYERIIDDKNVSLPPSKRIPKTPLKTAIAPHVRVSEDDLTFLGAEIEYQKNLKLFGRVENLACQCEKIIQTYGLQQTVETKAGKKKWRQVIISNIKPKLFSDRLGALAISLDTEI
jgi:hypothetical protein